MLHHVSLEVAPAEADRFARLLEIVGFVRVEAPEALGDAVRWFEHAGTQVHLILTEAARAPVLGHAALVVDNFDATLIALRADGFEVTDARELWGAPRAFVLAPSSDRIELMAEPPGRQG